MEIIYSRFFTNYLMQFYDNNIQTLFNLPVISMRKRFKDYDIKNNLQNEYKGILTADNIHQTDKGNQLIADRMIQALLTIK